MGLPGEAGFAKDEAELAPARPDPDASQRGAKGNMRISEVIRRLVKIQEAEGDIEVELPDGTLMRSITVYNRPPVPVNEKDGARKASLEAK
jgi:hypothetical protein